MNYKKIFLLGTIFIALFLLILGIFMFGGIDVVNAEGHNYNLDPQSARSFNENDTREIGFEFLDDNSVVHIWNNVDDYFIDKDSGIQLTNHLDDYWTKNVMCLGYYDSGKWNKIACNDQLTNFKKSIETDNSTYVNATMWKDITYGSYDLRIGVKYHLRLDDQNLSVDIYAKNIGIDIPFDIGFGWRVKNIEVPDRIGQDKIKINNTNYELDGIYDIVFDKLVRYNNVSSYFSGPNGNGSFIMNYTIVEENLPYFEIYDKNLKEKYSNNFLRLGWDENLNYTVKMYGEGDQQNFYIMLLVNAGHFNPDQEKFTTLYWIDALTDNGIGYYKLDETSGAVIDSVGNSDGTNGGATPNVAGKINTAYDFDASVTDSIDLNDGDTGGDDLDFLTADDFSICAWVSPDDLSRSSNIVVGKRDGSGYQYVFRISTSGTPNLLTTGGAVSGTSNSFAESIYQFFCVTRDGNGDTIFYVNGSAAGSGASLSISHKNTNAFIGQEERLSSAQGFDGKIDEVYIVGRVLSPSEITELWASNNGLTYPFLPLGVDCTFSGFVFDEDSNALNDSKITIFNQDDVTEFYETTTSVSGYWAINISNSTNTYMASAYFNNSLIGQLKPFISGTC